VLADRESGFGVSVRGFIGRRCNQMSPVQARPIVAQASGQNQNRVRPTVPKCSSITPTPHKNAGWQPALRGDNRQFYEAAPVWRVVDALGGFLEVARLGPEDIGDESLRIPVVEREPAGLDLHHYSVAWQEDMIRRGHSEFVEQRLIGSDRFRGFEAFPIAPAENIG